jgi:hypothetical protein
VYFLGKFWDLFKRNPAILQSAVHKNGLFTVFGDLDFKRSEFLVSGKSTYESFSAGNLDVWIQSVKLFFEFVEDLSV